MAALANIIVTFSDEINVVVKGDGSWEVVGDPGGLLKVDRGAWTYSPTAGTELLAKHVTQIVLVGWSLSSTTAGSTEEGDAYLFPSNEDDLGSFRVTLAQ